MERQSYISNINGTADDEFKLTDRQVPTMSEDDRREVIELFNATRSEYSQEKLIHQLIEVQAERTPDAVAVICGERSLTYAELNAQANQLARWLRENDVYADQRVGICVERGLEMVVGLLGILKAGGAYVPLDPCYPTERLEYMLRDSAPRVLLTQENLKAQMPQTIGNVITLDSGWSDIIQCDTLNLDAKLLSLSPCQLAYVIYTSGSTGEPKGVMVEHRNLSNLVAWHIETFGLKANSRSSSTAGLSFDATTWEIWPPLCSGGSLLLPPGKTTSEPQGLLRWWKHQTLDVSFLVTPLAELAYATGFINQSLRTLLIGGDRLQHWPKSLPSRQTLINNYGPTETTVVATSGRLHAGDATLHIGHPIANTRVYILDESMHPVPIGAAGEMYISGAGVARGYLNRPELTAQRFLADPFCVESGSRMYRTGDLGQWQADGTIAYLGRNDSQVKVRGFRIELGDIESTLLDHPCVRQAVLAVGESGPGEKRLVAYVVAESLRNPAADKKPAEAGVEIIGQWKTLYEQTYSAGAPAPSFIGWNSSYTGQPIPVSEMEEWLFSTVERIQALKPKRILEIGCGVGLLLQHLAPQCSAYVGTDFSAAAIEMLRQWITTRSDLAHVDLSQRSAAELLDFTDGSFDVVVLNSVVQYFPSIDYLLEVLEQAIRVLSPGGKIFLGDLRHFGLQQIFHSAVELDKASETSSVRQLRHRIARAVAQEKELVIDPEFFQVVQRRLPGLSRAEVQLKRGRASNELTRYRYDVVLHTGEKAETQPAYEAIDWSIAVGSAAKLEETLRDRRWNAVRLRMISNGRLTRDALAKNLIERSEEDVEIGSLRRQLNELQPDDIHPEKFWTLGEAYGYDVCITWATEGSPEYFEVLLRNRDVHVAQMSSYVLEVVRPWGGYANEPVASGYEQQLIPELREYLRKRLPEYMLPSAWMLLKQLPLTQNGKLDRNALPPPGRPEDISDYVAPRNNVERTLADVWEQVLQVDRVGVNDNFFKLGGHSLLLVKMIEQLRRLGLSVEIRSVYQCSTLAELALALESSVVTQMKAPPNKIPAGCENITPEMLPLVELSATQIEWVATSVPGGVSNIQDIYPLTPLQEGMLFHHILDERCGDAYVLELLLSFSSRDMLQKLELALSEVIARHDILRTAIIWEQLPQPVQVVYRRADLSVAEFVIDPNLNPVCQVRDHVRHAHERLNLRRAPLMCLHVAPDPNSTQWYAVLQLHHLAIDQVSMDIMLAEVMAYVNGCAQSLPSPEQYRNHVVYARAHAQTHDEQAFFRSKLADVDEPTAPFELLDVHGDGTRIEEVRQSLEPALAGRLRAQARRMSVSAATLFHAAWGLVVSRTSGRDDVVFGTVLLGGLQAGSAARRMLGLVINTLPLRLRLQAITVMDLVNQTQQELVELLNHEQASLAVAQRCSGVSGSTPLFSTLLNYFHSASDSDSQSTMAPGIQMLASRQLTNYPITVWVDDRRRGFDITIQADRSIDPSRVLGYLKTAVQSLVGFMEEAPETLALTLPILPQDEWRQVINLFNSTRTDYSHKRLVHELFEDQAAGTPDAVAVEHEGRRLTYSQLNRKANQLAHWLLNQDAEPNALMGICVGRGLEMVTSLLGCLKAGGAYVPLDPNYPAERLQHLLDDSGLHVVLTQRDLMPVLPGTSRRLIALGEKLKEISGYGEENCSAAELALTEDSLVYVIYTSGSTGRPKGTAMPHRSMVNLIEWHRGAFGPSVGKRVLQFAALSFDVAFQEIFSTLCTGGTLVLLDEWVRRDAGELMQFLRNHCIQRLFVPPLMLQSLAVYGNTTGEISNDLQDVITAGEQLQITPEITSLFQRLPSCRLHNHYGPTETHVVTALTLEGNPAEWPPLPPIGFPIANAQMYVLNAQRQPVPIGVTGEIYIGGAGVARDYLHQPAMTAECFVVDPFGPNLGARLYKTGDLGRWREDGALAYLGRNDDQVKIRGYRIELGDVEAQLTRLAQVRNAVVVVRQDIPKEKRLVAYVVLEELSARDPGASVESLRTHLKLTLPDYMVPTAFVVIERLPLTPNGKLDRRALPTPALASYATRQYEAPQGDVEETLAGIWQRLLQVERVGRNDNFFELGGHSLLMVQLMEQLRQADLYVRVREIYTNPALAALASVLTRESTRSFRSPPNLIPPDCEVITPQMLPLVELTATHIERIAQLVLGGAPNIQDIYPLAPLQEGILFHHLLNEEVGDLYVVPILLSLSSREKLEELIDALQRVMDRHDALRTAVLWDRLPRPVQVVYRRATVPVQHVIVDENRTAIVVLKERMRPERQRLDLRYAPPMRLQVAQDGHSTQWYALLQLHHLICDHESLEIVFSEVAAYMQGRAQALPQPVPYRDHVAQALAGARVDDAESFFRHKLADVYEPTAPFGLTDIHGDGSRIQEAFKTIEVDLSKRVRAQARRMGVSAASLFHAGWGLVVSHTSGRDDVVFGTVLLGRLQVAAGAQRILGMFINTLPIRLRIGGVTAEALVEQTHRELMDLLSHEQASLALAQRCSGVTTSAPLFTALFNYRHSALDLEAKLNSVPGVAVLATCDRTNYPLMLSVDDLGEGFVLAAHTDLDIDPHMLTEHMYSAMQSLVDALETTPQRLALTISILPESERRRILESFNATKAVYTQFQLVHEMVEEQALKTPDVVAVSHETGRLTYAQLNSRANQLARHLRDVGVGPDGLVGIYMERGPEMVVGLLAILKAGGAYVSLDPTYASERLTYLLEDSAPKALLTQERLKGRLDHNIGDIVSLDSDWSEIAKQPSGNLDARDLGLHPHHLAYLIYTSGSTGKPKGVAIEHRNAVNLVCWASNTMARQVFRQTLHSTSLNFDLSVYETFVPLSVGGTICLAENALALVNNPADVTLINTVPSAITGVLESGSIPKTTRVVNLAGEVLKEELVERIFQSSSVERVCNLYGPSETTTYSTWISMSREDGFTASIGHPIANTQIYIIDHNRQVVPIGVVGEIYIGGAGVARGYLNRPELTAERFVCDPFSSDARARMYKTGDLGRWRSDGTIEFLGRNDHQVKIRGFRIELGEIEAELVRHAQVKEAVVIACEDELGQKCLVAYVIAKNPHEGGRVLDAEDLRAYLRPVLPVYTVPSAFVMLESFPLTPSGKLDRRALPPPNLGANASRQYVPPQGETEDCLARIWQELLRVERVGRQDNFFDIGGHSLLATRAISRARELLEVELPLRAIFDAPTIEQLATRIKVEGHRRSEQEVERRGQLARNLREEIAAMQDDAVSRRIAELEAQLHLFGKDR